MHRRVGLHNSWSYGVSDSVSIDKLRYIHNLCRISMHSHYLTDRRHARTLHDSAHTQLNRTCRSKRCLERYPALRVCVRAVCAKKRAGRTTWILNCAPLWLPGIQFVVPLCCNVLLTPRDQSCNLWNTFSVQNQVNKRHPRCGYAVWGSHSRFLWNTC